jgi:hypothetical protein
MIAFFEKKNLPFVFLFVIVFISRLPFLSAGYGVEEDSWGIALAAFHTKCTGIYEPSRLPGHPFQEFILSALWGTGPVLFNASCAFFSAVGAVFFALILKQLKFKQFFLAAIAFAFVPVYYISSTYTIDFVWTQALILMAFYSLLKNRYLLCGVLLGLAIGCRVTSGVMLVPFMIIIWQNDFKLNIQRLLKMSIPMAVVAIALFIPVIREFGFSFFMYYDQFPYPPFVKVIYKMTIGVFGLVGVCSLVISMIILLLNKKGQQAGEGFEGGLDKKIRIASIVIIVLYVISYFRLPQKSGYMIPVIPFIILLFGYYLNRKNFNWFCWSMVLSSFLFGINLTDSYRGATHSKYAIVRKIANQEVFFDPFTGPVFSDYSKRQQKIAFTEEVIHRSSRISAKTVIIAGWWYNEIMVTMIDKISNPFIVYEPYINAATMNDYRMKNYEIYYLPEQNKYNDLMYKINVTDEFAKSFIE